MTKPKRTEEKTYGTSDQRDIELVSSEDFRDSHPQNLEPLFSPRGNEASADDYFRRLTYLLTHLELAKLPVAVLMLFRQKQRGDGNRLLEHEAAESEPPASVLGTASVPAFYASVLEGASYVTESLWPASFMSLWLHDIITFYTEPDNRYGTTMANIFLGTASNQLGFSSTYGTDLPTEALHWVVPTVVGSAIAAFTFSQCLYDYQKFYGKDPVAHESSLRRLRHLILWDKSQSSDIRYQAFDRLMAQAQDTHSLKSQISALQALSYIEQIASSYADHGEDRQNSLAHLAKAALNQYADNPGSRLVRWYAQYLRWSRGEAQSQKAHFWWLPFSLLSLTVLFSKMRLIAMWWRKAQELAQYNADKSACERESKVYTLTQSGDYECSMCGDWPFVYYGDIQSVQGCLDGVLALQNQTQRILEHLQTFLTRFNQNPAVIHLDLSKQPWANHWTDLEWDQFWTMVQSVPQLQVSLLNISTPAFNPTAVHDHKAQRLAAVLKNVAIHTVDMSKQHIDASDFVSIWDGMKNSTTLTDLHLSGTAAGDNALCHLASILPSTTLTSLSVGETQLTDQGLACLTQALPKTNVSAFYLPNNPLTEVSLLPFMGNLSDSKIHQLDLSNIALSANTADSLAKQLSRLTSLVLSGCALLDRHLLNWPQYVVKSRVSFYDLSDNFFSGKSLIPLLANLPNTTNLSLNLASLSMVKKSEWTIIGYLLSNQSVSRVDISKCRLFCVDFIPFIANLSSSQLRTLIVHDNLLDDSCMPDLAKALSGTHLLQTIDLSDNQISSKGGRYLISQLANTSLKVLNLRGNQLTGEEFSEYPHAIAESHLTELNMAGNPIAEGGVAQILQAIAVNTRVESVAMGSTSFSDEDSLSLAGYLIPYVPHFEALSQPVLQRDQQRWLHQLQMAASAKTFINQLTLSDSHIGDDGARALCHVAPAAHLAMSQLDLRHNRIHPDAVDISNCQISAASRLEPLFIFQLPKMLLASINHLLSAANPVTSAQETTALAMPVAGAAVLLPAFSANSYQGLPSVRPQGKDSLADSNSAVAPTVLLMSTLLALGLRRWVCRRKS